MHYLRSLFIAWLMLVSWQAVAGPVDINTADASTLAAAITGVGEKKAATIVRYRDTHGPFASVEELVLVKGIGAATIDRNRQNLTVGSPAR